MRRFLIASREDISLGNGDQSLPAMWRGVIVIEQALQPGGGKIVVFRLKMLLTILQHRNIVGPDARGEEHKKQWQKENNYEFTSCVHAKPFELV